MAWLYLRSEGWEEGYRKISQGLRQMAIAHRVPDKYHETITRFWALLVYHALQQSLDITDFANFADQFPQLFESRLLSAHYGPEVIKDPQARVAWVEPDLIPMPAGSPA
jgi:hypothetical protein